MTSFPSPPPLSEAFTSFGHLRLIRSWGPSSSLVLDEEHPWFHSRLVRVSNPVTSKRTYDGNSPNVGFPKLSSQMMDNILIILFYFFFP